MDLKSSLFRRLYRNRFVRGAGKLQHKGWNAAERFGSEALYVEQILTQGKPAFQKRLDNFARQILETEGEVENSEEPGFRFSVRREQTLIRWLEEVGVFRPDASFSKKELVGKLLGLGFRAPCVLSIVTMAFGLRLLLYPFTNPWAVWTPSVPAKIDPDAPCKILSWNAALTEFNLMNERNGLPKTKPRLPSLLSFLLKENPEVIALQEAFDIDDLISSVIPPLREAGYWVILTGTRSRVVGMTAGLLIASKYPVLEVVFEPFTNARDVDAWANKGVLAVRLEKDPVSHASCVVSNTHLQGSFHGLSIEEKTDQRAIQFQTIQTVLKAWDKTPGVEDIFLVGDFNTGRFQDTKGSVDSASPDPEYASMISSLFLPANSQDLKFKDLMVPVRDASFEEFRIWCTTYDLWSPRSNETGHARGTILETAAPSDHFFPEILQKELETQYPSVSSWIRNQWQKQYLSGDFSSLEPQVVQFLSKIVLQWKKHVYGKPNVTDHVCLADLSKLKFRDEKEGPSHPFQETGYKYRAKIPVGPLGILSDHRAVIVTVYPS